MYLGSIPAIIIFNILQNNIDFEGLKTLDLFGGTGCISYELASRGCSDLTIVEKDPKMLAFIKKTSAELNIPNFKIFPSEVFKFMDTCNEKFDLIFAGPPYLMTEIDELPKKVFSNNLLKPDGWFVLEHTPRNDYKDYPFFRSERNYGTTLFSFFKNEELA